METSTEAARGPHGQGKWDRREECPKEMVAQCPTDKTAPFCNQSQGQSTLLSSFCLDFLESRKPRHIRTESREKEGHVLEEDMQKPLVLL